MQIAVFQGLYGIKPAESFTCPGVCRWNGTYVSVGFKADCKNVTQSTLQTAVCKGDEDSLRQCNMTTPGGVSIASRAMFTEYATAYYMNTTSLVDIPSNKETLPDTWPEITRFAIYRSTPDYNFRMRDINITDCSLSIAAYEYTDAKANGSDFSFTSRREVDFGMKNPWTLQGRTDDTAFQRIYTNESTKGGIQIPALEIDYPNIQTLETYLMSATIVSEFVEGDFTNTNLGVAAALYGDVDIGDRFDGMATTMTDYLRYGPNTKSARGEVVQSEPFVFIRWWYFLLPVITEGIAIIFAILSIFSNRKSRCVPLWKSSTLAVLACNTNEQLGLLQTPGKGIKEIQAEAGGFNVQLE